MNPIESRILLDLPVLPPGGTAALCAAMRKRHGYKGGETRSAVRRLKHRGLVTRVSAYVDGVNNPWTLTPEGLTRRAVILLAERAGAP